MEISEPDGAAEVIRHRRVAGGGKRCRLRAASVHTMPPWLWKQGRTGGMRLAHLVVDANQQWWQYARLVAAGLLACEQGKRNVSAGTRGIRL